MTQHYAMLQRNLLYTGITRGKKLVVLVGQRKAVAIAARNASGRRRWSKLSEWLRTVGLPSEILLMGIRWRDGAQQVEAFTVCGHRCGSRSRPEPANLRGAARRQLSGVRRSWHQCKREGSPCHLLRSARSAFPRERVRSLTQSRPDLDEAVTPRGAAWWPMTQKCARPLLRCGNP
jgi:hypothetical protein